MKCEDCLFSENIESDDLMFKLTNKHHYRCVHENSPFYTEIVSCDQTCRLFEDVYDYFKQKQRLDFFNNILNKKSK